MSHLQVIVNKSFIGILGTGFLLLAATLGPFDAAQAQSRKSKSQPAPTSVLAELQQDFIKASNEYKASLERLLVSYDTSLKRAQERFQQSKELYDAGLISKAKLGESETEVAIVQEKIDEARKQMAGAEAQIASVLLETKAEAEIAKTRASRGSLVRTTSYIRYHGGSGWSLSEAWKVQSFFQEKFNRPLPVAVLGQGAIHNRWGLDHRNAMDVSLHPDSVEGQALMSFLRANGIPFLAFRGAVPGSSTGPHIHVGHPSHRY